MYKFDSNKIARATAVALAAVILLNACGGSDDRPNDHSQNQAAGADLARSDLNSETEKVSAGGHFADKQSAEVSQSEAEEESLSDDLDDGSASTVTAAGKMSPLIFGGSGAKKDYKFAAYMITSYTNSKGTKLVEECTGSLINRQTILTAAHCVQETGATVSRVDFHLGKNDRTTTDKKYKFSAGPGDIRVHPKFSGLWMEPYDIALIKLDRPVPDEIARPVAMRAGLGFFTGRQGKLLGYGLQTADTVPEALKELPLVEFPTKFDCALKPNYQSSDQYNCFGIKADQKPALKDSGGPVLNYKRQADGTYTETVGAVFASILRNSAAGPSVAYHRKWIMEKLGVFCARMDTCSLAFRQLSNRGGTYTRTGFTMDHNRLGVLTATLKARSLDITSDKYTRYTINLQEKKSGTWKTIYSKADTLFLHTIHASHTVEAIEYPKATREYRWVAKFEIDDAFISSLIDVTFEFGTTSEVDPDIAGPVR